MIMYPVHTSVLSSTWVRHILMVLPFLIFADERDPKKRKVKPVERHLLQVDFGLSDSENDSDFEIQEHDEEG